MSQNKPQEQSNKKVKIAFDPDKVFCYKDEDVIYGINVKMFEDELVGECDQEVFKSLKAAKKCK